MGTLVAGLDRWRLVVWTACAAVLLVAAFSGFLGLPQGVRRPLGTLGVVAIAVGVLTFVTVSAARRGEHGPDAAPLPLRPPVEGRWLAVNSPSSSVPSHGTCAYGQAFAMDLVFDPEDAPERPVGGMVPPERFPSFGRPVLAMVDGQVVTVSDWRRDHLSRTSTLALLYFSLVEGLVRTLGGPGWIVGNHVVIRTDRGDFALVAHLRRGSARVRVGERVRAGQEVGLCGNSGNSTEPHVHLQLMDRRSLWTAHGLPFSFARPSTPARSDAGPVGEGRYEGVPVNGEHLES